MRVLKNAWPTRLMCARAAGALDRCRAPRGRRARRRGCRRPGCFASSDSASSAVRKSPSTKRAGVVDEEAAVGVAVPGDAEVGALGGDLVDDERAVLLQQRVGLVVGEVAVGRPVGVTRSRPELLEQRPDHRAGHAVAAVDDDLQRLDRRRVDGLQRGGLELLVDVDLLDGAAAPGGSPRPVLDQPADVLDALVARQRDRAALDELGARVGLRVVRGGAHQPAVEVARADEEVEHLGADLAGVEHVRALGDHAVAVARGQLGRGQAHVAAEADAQLGRRLAASSPSTRAKARPIGSAASPSIWSPWMPRMS